MALHCLKNIAIFTPISSLELIVISRSSVRYLKFHSANLHSLNRKNGYSTFVANKKSSTLISPAHKDVVNAPLSTLPAPLNLPVKSDDMSKFKYLFTTGKAYLTFFKSGLGNVYKNFVATRPLQEALDTHQGSFWALLTASPNILTRSAYQHIHRTRHDIVRVPLFGLLFLIFGEFSPFVLPFVSFIVPYNCRIPHQLSRQRRISFQRRTAAFAALPHSDTISVSTTAARSLSDLNSREVKHIARVLEVDSFGIPLESLRRLRITKREQYLAVDDILLRRGGGVRAINSGEELIMAAQERGIDTIDKPEQQLREELDIWIRMTENLGGVRAGIWLLRPQSWVEVVKNTEK